MSDRERRTEVARAAQQDDPQFEDQGQDRLRMAAMVRRKAVQPTNGGSELDGATRGKMEKALGAELSGVRVHTDGDAAQRSEQLGARAYTEGADVHFAAGQFQPGTKEGDRLIAHELTHVIQGGANKGGGAAASAKSAGGGGSGAAAHRKAEPEAEGAEAEGAEAPAAEGGESEGKEAEGGEAGVEVSDPAESAETEADSVADQATEKMHGDGEKGAEGGEAEARESEGEDMGAAEKTEETPKISAKLDGAARKVYRWQEYDRATKENTGAAHTIADKGQFGGISDETKAKSDAVTPQQIQQLEERLGTFAFAAGGSVGQSLTRAIKRLLDVELNNIKNTVTDLDAQKEKQKQLMTGIVGTNVKEPEKVAGSVENTMEALNTVFATGNLREQMTIVFNFSGNFQNLVLDDKGVLKDSMKDELADKGFVLEGRLNEIRAQQQKKGVTVPDGGGVAKEGEGDKARFPRLPEANKATGLQDAAREETPRDKDGKQLPSNQPAPKGDATRDEVDNPTPDSLEDKGMGLSPEEQKVQEEGVNWEMGVNKWQAKANSEFHEKMQALKMPFAAGPSGTTARLCDTAGLLGEPVDANLRLGCIGYLLPIQAHSLWEIVEGAKTKGIGAAEPSFTELGIDAYDHIEGLESAVEVIKDELKIPKAGKKPGPDPNTMAPAPGTPDDPGDKK